MPVGGEVRVTIAGVEIVVATSAVQSLEDVLRALAVAINGDPSLSLLGISGSSLGPQLASDAPIDAIAITDPGIGAPGSGSPAVPALGLGLILGLASALAALGVRELRRR